MVLGNPACVAHNWCTIPVPRYRSARYGGGHETSVLAGGRQGPYAHCVTTVHLLLSVVCACTLQVAIVEMGGRAFSTVPLSGTQWAVCVGFGGLTLLLRQALRLVPTEPPPPGGSNGSSDDSRRQQWQQGAAAAVAAVRAAVAAPVQALQAAAAAAGSQLAGAPKTAAATKQSRRLQQPARR